MFEIKNIKISLKIEKISLNSVLEQLKQEGILFETKSNYIIIRDKFIYIFFKSKSGVINHINVTKIPKVEEIEISTDILKNKIFKNLNVVILTEKIDNITASYDAKKELNQFEILSKFRDTHNIRYNKEKFPGMFIKVLHGTFIIFHSGKINLVGCQNLDHLVSLFMCLSNILS